MTAVVAHEHRNMSIEEYLEQEECLDQSIELKSIGCAISLRDVYDKTENL
jgi:hypothetical protein